MESQRANNATPSRINREGVEARAARDGDCRQCGWTGAYGSRFELAGHGCRDTPHLGRIAYIWHQPSGLGEPQWSCRKAADGDIEHGWDTWLAHPAARVNTHPPTRTHTTSKKDAIWEGVPSCVSMEAVRPSHTPPHSPVQPNRRIELSTPIHARAQSTVTLRRKAVWGGGSGADAPSYAAGHGKRREHRHGAATGALC